MNSQKKSFTLSELASMISDSIDATFMDRPLWVLAETSDIKNYTDRYYCFLSLIEKQESKIAAKLDAVIWRSSYHIIEDFERTTRIKFDKNLKLLVLVNVSFSSQYGLKLSILQIDHNYTLGNIELERKTVLEKLVNENPSTIQFDGTTYTTYNKSLQTPPVIRNIALITAPTSDGQRDFKHELLHNKYGYVFEIDEYLTQIQGTNAAEAIIHQLRLIEFEVKDYDAVVIARGGGSQTDFTAFENYELAKLIAAFKIPIITGIGHERNVSIADMMSHLALKTPTKVANFIIDNNHLFDQDVIINYTEFLAEARNLVDNHKEEIESFKTRCIESAKNIMLSQKHAIDKFALSVKLLSPQNVLKRGYAIVSKEETVLIEGKNLHTNDKVNIQFLNETVEAIITKK